MSLGPARRLAVLLVVGVCALAYAGTAAADTSTLGCKASLLTITAGTLTINPIVANNPTTPCVTKTGGLNSIDLPSSSSTAITGGPAAVFTFTSASAPTTAGPVLPGATALVTVDGLTIPTASGNITIVGPVQAQAAYSCSTANGTPTATASSTLDVLKINGQEVKLTAPGAQQQIPLGNGSFIETNQNITTPTSITQRILTIHLQGTGDVVVGEAMVTTGASPCATNSTTPPGGGGGGGGGGTPPALSPCPAGSVLVIAKQLCEIILPNGTVIVISKPFEGPTGGTVLSLGAARKKFQSKCLFGAGPQYAIVGTNGPDRIVGTHRSERFLGLDGNDRIAGQGGNDCIDAGAGNDRVFGGNGKERIYGGSGVDRLSVQGGNSFVDGGPGNDTIFLGNGSDRVFGGSGNDRISVGRGKDFVDGGSGNDTISVGDGNDTINGGAGNDHIYAGNGRDHINGGSGNDRIFSRAVLDYTDCGAGQDLAYVVTVDAQYASQHGCEVVRKLALKKP